MWSLATLLAYCKLQMILSFLLLKNGLERVLGGTLQKCCACQRNCRSPAPASEILLGACFLCKRARFLLVSSAFELQPTVHAFSVERTSIAQDALAPVRFQRMEHCGESGGTRRYKVSSDGSISIADASRNPMLLSRQR